MAVCIVRYLRQNGQIELEGEWELLTQIANHCVFKDQTSYVFMLNEQSHMNNMKNIIDGRLIQKNQNGHIVFYPFHKFLSDVRRFNYVLTQTYCTQARVETFVFTRPAAYQISNETTLTTS